MKLSRIVVAVAAAATVFAAAPATVASSSEARPAAPLVLPRPAAPLVLPQPAAPLVLPQPAAPLVLPQPSGRYDVGTVPLHLVDHSRLDPWVEGRHQREVMINVWYPARHTAGYPRASWLAPGEVGPVGRDFAVTLSGQPSDVPGLGAVRTHGALGAPVAEAPGGHPVVLFSPGSGAERNSSSGLVEDLASRGYVVVTIDHTHDATAVEFPGGRVELNTINALLEQSPDDQAAIAAKMVATRVADARFVLDRLGALNAGSNPDAEKRPLPRGLTGALRLNRVGMAGHSMGGATAAQVELEDPRVVAGVNLDGNPYGSVVTQGLDEPFLMVASGNTTRENTPAWGTFEDHLRGWHHQIKVAGTEHLSYHDGVLARSALAELPGVTPEVMTQAFGTLDGRRVVDIERAYVGAFFDLHLRGQDRHLFDGASPRYPEVGFVS
ncbi:hypothetical protein [Cryptosporangium sp. NPDC051539]|uniref:alpha/beta hydrolase family protein n=1 Tax=Cryptosporangium sp. NPDC051539 TaxID=3363962 RepID=UPI0037B79683